MPTIPIFLREAQYEKLRDMARSRNTTVAAIVREAVDMYLRQFDFTPRTHLRPIRVAPRRRSEWEGESGDTGA